LALALWLVTAGSASAFDYTVSGSIYWEGVGPASNVTVDWYIKRQQGIFWEPAGRFKTDGNGRFQGKFPSGLYYGSEYVEAWLRVPGQVAPIHIYAWAEILYPYHFQADFRIPRPLFLLHGVGGDASTWSGAFPWLSFPTSIPPWSQFLTVRPLIAISLPAAGSRTHVENASVLAATIDQYRTDLFKVLGRPSQPLNVDIAAHSSGGLVARAYIANHTGGPGQNTVRKCITVGSPHVGVVWIEALPPNHPVFALYPAVFQMRIRYLILNFPGELKGGYGKTLFYLVGSSLNVSPVEPESIVGWPFSRDDDGIVSTYSATFPFSGGKIAASKNFPHFHFTFPSQTDVAKQIVEWLK